MEQMSPGQVKKTIRQLKQRQEQYMYYLGQLAYEAGEQGTLEGQEMLDAYRTLKEIEAQIVHGESTLVQIKAAKEAAQKPSCPNCGGAVAKNAAFCPNCGSSLAAPQPAPPAAAAVPVPPQAAPAPAAASCSSCGSPLDADAVFCGNCGAQVGAEPAAPAAPTPATPPPAAEAKPATAQAAPEEKAEEMPAAEETLACPGCGFEIMEVDMRFCPECGTKVRE